MTKSGNKNVYEIVKAETLIKVRIKVKKQLSESQGQMVPGRSKQGNNKAVPLTLHWPFFQLKVKFYLIELLTLLSRLDRLSITSWFFWLKYNSGATFHVFFFAFVSTYVCRNRSNIYVLPMILLHKSSSHAVLKTICSYQKRKGELSFPPPDLRWKVKFLHKSFSKEV